MTAKIIEFPLGSVYNKESVAKEQYKKMIHVIVEEFFHNGMEFEPEQQAKIVPALKVLEAMIYEHHDIPHEHSKLLEHFAHEFSKRMSNENN